MQGKRVRGGIAGVVHSRGALGRRLCLAAAIVFSGTTAAIAAPVLQFSKTPDSQTVLVGQEMRFTFTITNIGDQNADFPQLVDELPGAGLVRWRTDVTKEQNSACFFDINQGAQTLFCDFEALAPGGTIKAFITATPTTCPFVLNNTATVQSSNAQPKLVTDSGQINVACEPTPRCDISIDKTCSIEAQSRALPPALSAKLLSKIAAIEVTVEAALSGSFDLFVEALLTDGSVTDPDAAAALARDLIEAHKIYLPQFA